MLNKTIAVLIPVFNGLDHTSKCLSKLYSLSNELENKSDRLKIIVINDGSSDGTVSWIETNYPQTILIHGDGNLWWSGGINLGAKYAFKELSSDYILMWNNDITPGEDYFKNLFNIIDKESADIVGSKIYYLNEPRTIWSMGGIFDTKTGKKHMVGMDEIDSSKFEMVHSVDWLPGMGTLVHRRVFDKIGFVDQRNFPQYHGDSDFTFRAKIAGFSINVYPNLKIWNDKSHSGLLHDNKFKTLFKSLGSIKSNYHIGKDLRFYHRYATSYVAYKTLIIKYCYYVGGCLKWKLLSLLGYTKRN